MKNVLFPGLGLEFSLNSEALSIGGFSVKWYGIIIAFGLVLACFYAFKNAEFYKLDKNHLIDCIIVGLICAIIGARLYYVAFEWDTYSQNPIEILYIHNGGLAIYGGIIGAFIGGTVMAKIHKMKIFALYDVTAIGFLIGQGIGRWGNFFNQEAFGTPTNLPWRMVSDSTGGVGVHPCFLYESVWCILGFCLLHYISRNHYKWYGQLISIYLVWYGAERMVVEGLRTDSLFLPFTVFGFDVRVSQLVSAIIFIAGVVLLIVNRKKDNVVHTVIMDGKAVSKAVKDRVKADTEKLVAKGITPGLAVIIVGDNSASKVYVRNKEKACEEVGFYSEKIALPEETTQQELMDIVKELNERQDINGILCQLPLPKHLDENEVIKAISPLKDVDAFNAINVGKIMIGDYDFLPCTPAGVMEMIHHYNIPVEGKECVVIGRSNIVGKPMAMLLLHENGTVTMTHSRTKDLKEITLRADIIVVAIGKAKFLTEDMVKKGATVIDVGMDRDENGKLCGDVDFEKVQDKCSFITPVPGGVGPMTISVLMKNTLKACMLQNSINSLDDIQ